MEQEIAPKNILCLIDLSWQQNCLGDGSFGALSMTELHNMIIDRCLVIAKVSMEILPFVEETDHKTYIGLYQPFLTAKTPGK